MQIGAERMCMPAPSVDQFMHAIEQTVLANKRWVSTVKLSKFNYYTIKNWVKKLIVVFSFCQVPPPGKGSLYIRPLLMGSGAILGLAPAPEYMFLVYAAPVGTYFKVCRDFSNNFCLCSGNSEKTFYSIVNYTYDLQEGMAPINLLIEDEFHRASPGGTGGVKAIANYAPVCTVMFIISPN